MASILSADNGTVSGSAGLKSSADSSGILQFQTGANTTAVTIDASQNVGVGTDTPGTKFHVNNSGAVSTYLRVSNASSTSGLYLGLDSSGESLFSAVDAKPLKFLTTNTERMRIDASGNLGLGVTPSAWNSAWKAIQIGAGANFVGRTGVVNQLQLIANGYFNGTNYIYQNTGEATQYFQTGGYHAWGIAPSGTAGNAISFTQAMTLDASGNLLVGATNTTPSSSPNNTIVGGSFRTIFASGSVANAASSTLFTITTDSAYLVTVQTQNASGLSTTALVRYVTGGNPALVTIIAADNVAFTVTISGTAVRVTNTLGGAVAYAANCTRIF